jgi:hypothetical protein
MTDNQNLGEPGWAYQFVGRFLSFLYGQRQFGIVLILFWFLGDYHVPMQDIDERFLCAN